MFWKKQKCDHDWHHLQDTPITANYGLDIDDGCYIFCSLCQKEELVSLRYWERIRKKQEILKDLNKSTYE